MKKLPRHITSKKILKTDMAAGVLLVLCLFALRLSAGSAAGLFQMGISVSNAYIARMDSSGNTYVVDEEHTRVLKLNTERRVEFSITENSSDDDTISYVGDMAVDGDGTIYLVEDHWGGLYLDREAILVYDSDGKYAATVYDCDFDGAYVDKRQVTGLTVSGHELWYAILGADEIQINVVDTSSYETRVYAVFQYENAFNAVYDISILPESGTVYVLDKRCTVVRMDGSGQETVYNTADDPARAGETSLYMMAVDSAETVYLTDIKGNSIYKLNRETGGLDVILSGSTVLSVSVTELADDTSVLSAIYGGQVYVTDTEGNLLWCQDTFARSGSLLAALIWIYALLLAGVLATVWLIARVLVFLATRHYSDTVKSSLTMTVAVVLVAAVIVVQLMASFRDVYTDELFEKLYISARLVSSELDADVVGEVNDPEDFMSDAYNTLIEQLETLLNRDYEYNQNIYCNILKYEDGTAWAVAYLDQSVGCYYPLDAVETGEVREVYETGNEVENGGKADVSGTYAYVKVPVFDEDGAVAAVVAIGSDTYIIDSEIASMQGKVLVTLVTLVLMMLFLFGEGMGFLTLRGRYRAAAANPKEHEAAPMPLHMIRLIVCVTFFAFNMSTSFLSAYAARLVTDRTGLLGDFAASLPITLNLAFMGIMSLFTAPLMARFSFRKIASFSAVICFCGDMTTFLSGSYPGLLIGLSLNGVGVGLVTNCISMFIVGSNDTNMKRDGLALYNSGSISGINIGSMAGAFAAGILGQQAVFAVSSAVWIFVVLLFLVSGRYMEHAGAAHGAVHEAHAAAEERPVRGKKAGFGRFISSPSVWGYMLCVQVPYIMLNSFIYYYVPIYGDANGYSENTTCLLLMIHSLCSVFFGESISGFMMKRFGERTIYLSSVMSLAALLLFAANPTVAVLVVTLLIMGISTSFGVAAKGVYFTELPRVREYGEEESMGVYNLADNAGESIGPMIFSPLMASGNLLLSMLEFVSVTFGAGAAYAVLSRFSRAKAGGGKGQTKT